MARQFKTAKACNRMLVYHGVSNHRLYPVFSNMLKRCNDPKCDKYPIYGGRGIKVFKAWQEDPGLFVKWAEANGYEPGLTIDRIDNNGDYSPENCRWVNQKTQQRNRRDNHLLTAFGETKTIAEWIEDPRCTIKYPALLARVHRLGWPDQLAVETPSMGMGGYRG